MQKQDKDSQTVRETSISGLWIINRPIFRDERGFFREIFRLNELEEKIGFPFEVVQTNHSKSYYRVLRGFHAENWNKLVYPLTGKVFIAIADIRPESKTFSKVETFVFDNTIKDSVPKALFISKGLANSFCVLSREPVNYIYFVDAYYDGSDARAVLWNDPDLGVSWPTKDLLISERDKSNPTLRQLFPEKFK